MTVLYYDEPRLREEEDTPLRCPWCSEIIDERMLEFDPDSLEIDKSGILYHADCWKEYQKHIKE